MRTDGGAGTSPARNGGSLPCHMLRAPLLALSQTELGTLSTDPTGVPDHVDVVKRGGGGHLLQDGGHAQRQLLQHQCLKSKNTLLTFPYTNIHKFPIRWITPGFCSPPILRAFAQEN